MIYFYLECDALDNDIRSLFMAFYPGRAIKRIETKEYACAEGDLFLRVCMSDCAETQCLANEDNTKKKMAMELMQDGTLLEDACECELSDRKDTKTKAKCMLYCLLSKLTKKELPWGTLTGIRPTKIARTMLMEGASDEECIDYMKNRMLCGEEKTMLSLDIAKREIKLLYCLDYEDGYSLYVGIAFCPTTCAYCSFTSYPVSRFGDRVDAYLDSIEKEIDYVAEAFKDKKLNTIYIGGGTPTTLEPDQLERLLSKIENSFNLSFLQEWTVEAGRPDSITREKLKTIKRRPVTRISINPQTMKDETLELIGRRHTVLQVKDALFTRQGELQDIIDATDAWNLDSKLERAMDALRCPPENQSVANLSGGERRRVALCRLLLQKPDVLLLDEPTNHLDAESIDWLEQHLQQYEGTVIAVTHDRYFLDHVAGWILELDRGEGIPWKGNYSSWLEQKTKRMEMEEKTASKRRKTLERELEWVRMAPKARQAKGKARLNSYDKLLNEDVKEKEEKLEIFIPNGPRLGNRVIEAKHVAKAYGDKLLFDDLNFVLPPNGIVGVIGPNGAGKTTLFRLIMGLETVDKGEFEVGETVKVAYVDQQHKDIDPNKSVYQVISGGNDLLRMGGRDINARAYLSRFNFSGADQEKLCGVLSGGERNRLHLAMALKEEGNVLLLDEPTNDIDVNTLRALEEGLEDFAGCAVVISHDRWFLDRICTHILAFEGDSNVFYFEGSYSEYEENKLKRLGNEEPKRVRYRKLMTD